MISVWGIFDLIDLGQDTLFAWGTGYIEVGRGMGDIPALPGSSRWGKDRYNEIWPEALGFNLLGGDLKPVTNKSR